jgi:hypothetical protein
MSTDRDREGEKLLISGGAWRSGKKTEEEISEEFERFLEVMDPNEKYADGVKRVARDCYFLGVRESERMGVESVENVGSPKSDEA